MTKEEILVEIEGQFRSACSWFVGEPSTNKSFSLLKRKVKEVLLDFESKGGTLYVVDPFGYVDYSQEIKAEKVQVSAYFNSEDRSAKVHIFPNIHFDITFYVP